MPNTLKRKNQSRFFFLSMLLLLLAGGLSIPAGAGAVSGVPASFADLAEKLSPVVVNIYTTQIVKSPYTPYNFFFNDRHQQLPELFRRFFDMPYPQSRRPQQALKRTSLGSGVITSADGYILTNNHVVENADAINVRLGDYEEYEAKIIGRDAKSDIALIKIEPKNSLPFVTFGDSDKLRVGDWVVAIGNPFGFSQTVTAGIVSGKGRSLGGDNYANFIQTDASINPGNSGGPLFNLQGEMVGINTAIFSRSGGNIGIGFAIPVNLARSAVEQLKEHGNVIRGWLGVMIQQVTPELAEQFKLEHPVGALVSDVTPDGPADKAGIRSGDVITDFDGREVTQMNLLPSMVAQTPVGKKVKIRVIRNGERKQFNVIVGTFPDDGEGGAGSALGQDYGLSVQELTPELAESLGIEKGQGVLVANVEPDSVAAEAGIRRGDLILEINRRPVNDLKDFDEVLGQAGQDNRILLLIEREGHSRFVLLRRK